MLALAIAVCVFLLGLQWLDNRHESNKYKRRLKHISETLGSRIISLKELKEDGLFQQRCSKESTRFWDGQQNAYEQVLNMIGEVE